GGFLNYINPGVDVTRDRNDSYRVDHYFNDKFSLMARVAYESDVENPPALTWGWAGFNPAPTTTQTNRTTGLNALARFTAHISPTTFNEFTFDETYDKVRILGHNYDYLADLSIQKPFLDQKHKNPQVQIASGWAGLGSYVTPVIASDSALPTIS